MYSILFCGEKSIGYTHTYQEAEDICRKYHVLSWCYGDKKYIDKHKLIFLTINEDLQSSNNQHENRLLSSK
mgnify:CR=1 FL=1